MSGYGSVGKARRGLREQPLYFGRLLPCRLHRVANFPQALSSVCLGTWFRSTGPLSQGMWDRDTVCCVLEQSCWHKINEAWTPGSQSWEPNKKTRNLQGDCLTRLTEECLWAGHSSGLMLCFRENQMCLTARDHTSWLIPASSIFLSPMSTTTHPNRPLTKCLLVMMASNTNISSATAEVCVNNSDSICLWSLDN